uniref:Uncharacterized protein n=1 Tax=Utricularia reniformis TaxID=192314 RepID=A0A1Y0AZM9_9LAMI|nr:hypothetical protein AEK19_MT0319 [Utricularia reniformis]ART30593.1 hypothetical protein AEK19_MT0319 [Utricularia reniformis]
MRGIRKEIGTPSSSFPSWGDTWLSLSGLVLSSVSRQLPLLHTYPLYIGRGLCAT